jgi:primary-amine oxidase
MPAEPMTLLLRPRNFFDRNPVLDVPPSYARSPSQVLSRANNCACKKNDGSSVLV